MCRPWITPRVGRPWGRVMAGLMLAALASRALIPPLYAGKHTTANVGPDGRAPTAQVQE